jgi:alpha-beta hydrolase superfamily lysophospholipase
VSALKQRASSQGALHTDGMDDSLTTADGLALQLREWPCERPHGSVLIVHGLGEHIGRYLHVAQHLNDWGWNVIGYDQRGHGASEGPRGRLAAADDLLLDLSRVIDAVRAAHDGPLVLLGHSLGGLVAARFVAEGVLPAADANGRPAAATDRAERPREPALWHRKADALVLSSPALDTGMRASQKMLLAVLGPLTPNLAVGNGLKAEWISRAPSVVTAYNRDPLVHDRIAPRLARFLVDSGPFVLQRAAAWNVPTLLMYAGSDRCVEPAGSAAFAAAAPGSVVSVRRFQPLFHEIFNEPEQVEVFTALRDWLAAQARHL